MANKARRKNILKTVAGLSLAVLMLGTGTGLLYNLNKRVPEDSVVDQNSDFNIHENGIGIRYVSSKNNSYNQKDQTFTYTITPDNADNQTVTVALKYKDGSDCSAVMTSSVNAQAKTITLSCKAAFNKQIIATVTSSGNAAAKAEITLDYVKKVLSLDTALSYSGLIIDVLDENNGDCSDVGFNLSNYIDVNYSIFSKDKSYPITLGDFTLKDGGTGVSGFGGSNITYAYKFNASELLTLQNAMKTAFSSGTFSITEDWMWNLSSSNTYHSALKKDKRVSFTVSSFYIKVGDKQFDISHDITCYNLYKNSFTFATKIVNVDSLSVETRSIDF